LTIIALRAARPPTLRRSPTTPVRGGSFASVAARPVDGASLAVVRIVFGLVGLLVAVRTLANGWVESLYAGPSRHFTYAGFGWVAPPPGWGAYALVATIGVAGLLVALGWHYRVMLAAFLVAFVWLELVEVTTYLNHYWFVTLFGCTLLAVPATSCWSLDARRRPSSATTVPLGAVWLLRGQVATVYVFAGLAKLNADWLLHGLPLRLWLPGRTHLAIVGPWLDETWVAIASSWAGAAFDCLIVPALLWKRTRFAAWCTIVVFHVLTWRLFPIGVFPWVMIAVSTLFFEPDWPRRVASRIFGRRVEPVAAPAPPARNPRVAAVVVAIGVAWLALQVAIPLRHWFVPGDYRWTNEGYRFAWVVLLTEKGGDVSFRVHEPATGREWIETADDLYTPAQWRVMATEPDLIRQAAHAIAARQRAQGRHVEVRADAFVALNGRPAARLVRPDVDLAREPWRVHQPWILPAPTAEPLPGR
jgi:hypothetical protein